MKNLSSMYNESIQDMRFKQELPDLDFDDDYQLKMMKGSTQIGYIIYTTISDDMFEDEVEEIADDLSDYDEIMYVREFYIDPKYRGKGYGTKLLKEFLSKYAKYPCVLYASSYGLGKSSALSTPKLKAYYHTFGFNQIGHTDYFIKHK